MLKLTRFRALNLSRKILGRQPNRYVMTSPLSDIQIPEMNYVEFLLENANKFSQDVALIDGVSGSKYTFSDISETVKNISSGLVKLGLRRKEVVCIFSSNSPEFVLAECGILAAGATATFANPASQPNELAFLLQNTQTKFVITTPALLPAVEAAAEKAKSVTTIFVMGTNEAGNNCTLSFNKSLLEDNGGACPLGQFQVNPHEEIALLPHSSGTTGVPKPVMLTHHNVCANISQIMECNDPNRKDVMLGLLPFYHIAAMVPLTGYTLRTGSTTVTLPDFKPDTFLSAIEKYKLSFLPIVPPILLFMINHPSALDYDLSSVTRISCGAAPLERSTEDAFRERFKHMIKDMDLAQAYGLTEASPVSHCMPYPGIRKAGKEGSVGILVPNMKAKIVDPETCKEVCQGEMGELLLQGPNIMKGYLNNPAATQEAIRDGWLHTGDIFSCDEDGYCYVFDRIKDCIKYKGIQVAPAELEALLITHPLILDAAVVRQKDSRAGEVPAAFIVSKGKISEDEIRSFVADQVADHKKIRGLIRFIEKIPKTPSGKILKADLCDFNNMEIMT